MEIDVEKGHRGGSSDSVQHRLSANEHWCRRDFGIISTPGDFTHLGMQQRGDLFSQSTHTGAQCLHPKSTAGGTDHGALFAASRTDQTPF
jgi:hypothetical protein